MTNATPDLPVDQNGSPFWKFSLGLYRHKPVQEACIELQDSAGVDVNVLLFVMWLASSGRELSDEETGMIVGAVDGWRNGVVVPLRTARRNLREPPTALSEAGAKALRLAVKRLELESERLQQEALYALAESNELGTENGAQEAAAANITTYSSALGRTFPSQAVKAMLDAFRTRDGDR